METQGKSGPKKTEAPNGIRTRGPLDSSQTPRSWASFRILPSDAITTLKT